jgi:hypothetical protein
MLADYLRTPTTYSSGSSDEEFEWGRQHELREAAIATQPPVVQDMLLSENTTVRGIGAAVAASRDTAVSTTKKMLESDRSIVCGTAVVALFGYSRINRALNYKSHLKGLNEG